MTHRLLVAATAALLTTAAHGASPAPPDALLDGFADPPASARPRTWWHWMNGNVTKDGIAKDLAWMKAVGHRRGAELRREPRDAAGGRQAPRLHDARMEGRVPLRRGRGRRSTGSSSPSRPRPAGARRAGPGCTPQDGSRNWSGAKRSWRAAALQGHACRRRRRRPGRSRTCRSAMQLGRCSRAPKPACRRVLRRHCRAGGARRLPPRRLVAAGDLGGAVDRCRGARRWPPARRRRRRARQSAVAEPHLDCGTRRRTRSAR